MSERIDQHLVMDALNTAVRQGKPKPGLIHHTDRGAAVTQYGLYLDTEKAGHGAEQELAAIVKTIRWRRVSSAHL